MNNKLKQIYKERASIYNCDIDVFEEYGSTVLDIESMRNKDFFTLAKFEKHTFIRKDPEMALDIEEDSLNGSNVLDNLKEIYENRGRKIEKTYCYYYYLSDKKIDYVSKLDIKNIREMNNGLEVLNTYLNNLTEDELDLADIKMDNLDPIIFGGFEEDNMVAYISHRYPESNKSIADMGIVTSKDYRGKGYGKSMLVHEVNYCIEHGLIPMYIVLDSNTASCALVEKTSFKLICEIYKLV